MRLNIEATLFRPEQADPFFDSLQTYRDDRLWVTFGNSWLELEKAKQDKTSDNVPYNVVGANVSGDGSLPERILKLFEQRFLPIEIGSASERKLPDVDRISTKALAFEMSKLYEKKRGPSHETSGVLIQNMPLWRPEQLHVFSIWMNSYYDRKIEVGMSACRKRAYLMLRKFGSHDDGEPPYVVAGCASEEMDIFKYLAGMFPMNQDHPPVKAYVTKAGHNENWRFFKTPMRLDSFASVVSLEYAERKRS